MGYGIFFGHLKKEAGRRNLPLFEILAAAKGRSPERITFEHDGGGAPDTLEFLRRSVCFFKQHS